MLLDFRLKPSLAYSADHSPCIPLRSTATLAARSQLHGTAYILHSLFGADVGAVRTVLEDFFHLGFGEACSQFLNGRKYLHERVRRPALALDASDSRRTAAFIHVSQRFRRRKHFVQVANRALVRISWIGAPDARRVRHHGLQLLSHYRLGVRHQDRVA